MKPLVRLLVALLVLNSQVLAQNSKPTKAVEPSWVTRHEYDYSNTSLDKQAEYGSIDLVSEVQFNLKDESAYYNRAYKIISEAGVQNNSELSFSYDPSYSRLIFHFIRIRRGQEIINQLDLSKIKTIQQELELARHSYDGSLSSVVFLEDVRKGDIIEYSYTVKGFNPIFNGKFSRILNTSYSSPLYNLYYKLIVPPGRNINIKNSLIEIKPEVKTEDGNTSYEWKISNLSALKLQDNVPSWFDLYSMIMISEYNNWSEVNNWARTLFPKNSQPSPGLKKKVEEINASYATNEGKIIAALRFVQDDVRYMGFEMGVNSHKPSPPNKIFAQRYGDCKDKSFLLCSILNSMGIEADPVLINTTYKKTIDAWLPSPTVFDHATVRVKLDNRFYWLDPTISYQRGRLENISYPDYQRGLVITDTTTSLTMIPFRDNSLTKVKETFDIPNMRGDAKLTVVTDYTGTFADDMRRSMNTSSNDEMKESNRKYYANYFDKIEADSLTYSSNDSTGVFTVWEYYSIHEIWKNSKGKKRVTFEPYVINGVMTKPKDVTRKMPFHLSYPAKYKEEIEINLPDDWQGEESENNVRCSGFKMKSEYSYKYRQFNLSYDYENLKDHVDPSEIDEYLEKYNKASQSIAYELSRPGSYSDDSPGANAAPSASTGVVLIVILLVIIVLVVYVVRRI